MSMDYEKAYKEALERARAGKPMNEVFPELKESEDERIRKALLKLVSNDKNNGYTEFYKAEGITCDDAIAYLEKQKAQQPAEWSEEDEAIANLIIKELEQDKDDAPEYSRHFTRLLDWLKNRLKSLHPHWKPSEEQMRVFWKANPVNLMPEELSVYNSLCNDIQKLM